jgi:hypothetical protein
MLVLPPVVLMLLLLRKLAFGLPQLLLQSVLHPSVVSHPKKRGVPE